MSRRCSPGAAFGRAIASRSSCRTRRRSSPPTSACSGSERSRCPLNILLAPARSRSVCRSSAVDRRRGRRARRGARLDDRRARTRRRPARTGRRAAADGASVGDPVARSSSDPAAILFTSGTSGVPEGRGAHSRRDRDGCAQRSRGALVRPGDVVFGAAPFSHVLGQSTGLVATFACGGAVAVVDDSSRATLAAMVETGTTVFLGVPTMFIALCEAARGAARCRDSASRTSVARRCRTRSRASSSARSAPTSTRATG